MHPNANNQSIPVNSKLLSDRHNGSAQSLNKPGAPPVNRLIDMLNKPTFGSTGSNNSSAILTPNENRINNKFGSSGDYYNNGNSENRSLNVPQQQQDLSCMHLFSFISKDCL